MTVVGTTKEWNHKLSTKKEEHQKEVDLKKKGMEQVNSNGLVPTENNQSGV